MVFFLNLNKKCNQNKLFRFTFLNHFHLTLQDKHCRKETLIVFNTLWRTNYLHIHFLWQNLADVIVWCEYARVFLIYIFYFNGAPVFPCGSGGDIANGVWQIKENRFCTSFNRSTTSWRTCTTLYYELKKPIGLPKWRVQAGLYGTAFIQRPLCEDGKHWVTTWTSFSYTKVPVNLHEAVGILVAFKHEVYLFIDTQNTL